MKTRIKGLMLKIITITALAGGLLSATGVSVAGTTCTAGQISPYIAQAKQLTIQRDLDMYRELRKNGLTSADVSNIRTAVKNATLLSKEVTIVGGQVSTQLLKAYESACGKGATLHLTIAQTYGIPTICKDLYVAHRNAQQLTDAWAASIVNTERRKLIEADMVKLLAYARSMYISFTTAPLAPSKQTTGFMDGLYATIPDGKAMMGLFYTTDRSIGGLLAAGGVGALPAKMNYFKMVNYSEQMNTYMQHYCS